MKAAGLMKGSQPEGGAELPTGQSRLHSGFLKGTPGTMSGLTTRLKSVPPSLFGSVMNGRNGVPPGIRKTPDTVHLPKSPFTTFGASERNIRPRPSGMSQMAVEVKLCFTSKVEMARSVLSGAPRETWPRAWPVERTLVSGLASEAVSRLLPCV